jgi:hypothetical protein
MQLPKYYCDHVNTVLTTWISISYQTVIRSSIQFINNYNDYWLAQPDGIRLCSVPPTLGVRFAKDRLSQVKYPKNSENKHPSLMATGKFQ